MANEKSALIKYQGSQIAMYSDERNDYVNLTHLANAHERRKSILTWLRSSQTIKFLDAWEKKYNINYNGAQLSAVLNSVQERTLTIKQWIDVTGAKGIFTKTGEQAGTYAHKDIALKFAAWLSPEFELYLVEEIQKLKELERKTNSLELLSHEQILSLVRLKEVFKYVAHQESIENAHKDVFASRSNAKNPFADFHKWRNTILDISPKVIDDRIKQYCEANNINLTTTILNKTKREKILMVNSYESVRNAVWDFLSIKGEVNALTLAQLAENMIKIEQGEILRNNESDLFHTKQDLGAFSNFLADVEKMKEVKTARQALALREAKKKNQLQTSLDKPLKGILAAGKPPKEDKAK